MSHYVLDKAYRAAPENGIPAGAVVVRGTTADECTLPAAANAGNILGIATHAQPRTGRHVAIRRLGIAQAVAAGAIAAGAPVCIADTAGRVAQLAKPRFVLGSGVSEIIIEWLDPVSFSAAIEVELHEPEADGTFEWEFNAHRLRLTLSLDEEEVTETVASLVASVNGDAVLSKLVRAIRGGSAVDATVLSAASAHAGNIPATLNPLGTAEHAATQAGDLIDVFLTP